jgi:L-malate glycosyltransferase
MSGWYPVPENPTHGIFVQRHAMAVSTLHDVAVLYTTGTIDRSQKSFSSGNKKFSEHLYFFDKTGKTAYSKFKTLKSLYEQGFEKLIREWGKPDVIHLSVVFPAGVFALQLSKKYKIPLVITEHWTGYLPEDGSYKGVVKKIATKKIVAGASAICPVTKHLAKHMKQHGLNGNYFIIPNVVDTDFFMPGKKTKPTENTVFLHLSSLDERQKNPRSIIDAFKLLSDENQHVSLLMAGDGNNIHDLEKYAASIGVKKQKIEFHFSPLKKELVKIMNSVNVLVLNSNYENLPVVLLEAMSCGLPVISSDVGGINEYVNSKNGILFSPPSTNALLNSMKKYIHEKKNFNADYIREFAIKNFSVDVIAEQYNKVYQTIS